MNNSNLQQLANQFQEDIQQLKIEWVFEGEICTVREMADKIWHEDCTEKAHFILKYE